MIKKSRQLKRYVLIYKSTYLFYMYENAGVLELVDGADSKSKWIFLIVILKSIDKYTGLGFGRI